LRVASLAKAGVLEWDDGRRQLAAAASRCGLPDAEIGEILGWAWVHAQRRMTHMALGRGLQRSSICVIPGPPGASLERAKRWIPHVAVPAELIGNRKLEPLARMMVALNEEAVRRGQDTFHAGCRLIAELAGEVNPKTALRRLGALGQLGYLSLVEPGVPGTGPTGTANIWAWHDPPRPGESQWNGAGRSPRSGAAGSGSGSGRR
jgi:hypothetical protein